MLNRKAWELKHQLIAKAITNRGDFDLEEINREVFETLGIDSYELPEENQSSNASDTRVVDALRKVLR